MTASQDVFVRMREGNIASCKGWPNAWNRLASAGCMTIENR